MDLTFRRRGFDYGWCSSDLYSKGLTEVGDVGRDLCMGIFFVKEKDDLIRMIVSPAITNLVCRTPPYTPLLSSSALADLQAQPGCTLHKASGDVDCCFFQYLAPESLRWLFGLPAPRCKEFSSS